MAKAFADLLLPILLFTVSVAQLAVGADPATPSERKIGSGFTAAGFADPPVAARPRGMWVWPNGIASLSRITHEMEEMKSKGMGGLEIWDVGLHIDREGVLPRGPDFLEGESLAAVGHALREGSRLGLEMGLNTTNTFAAPQYGAMDLHRSQVVLEGPRQFSGELPFPQVARRHKRFPPLLERDESGKPVVRTEVAVLAVPEASEEADPVPSDRIIDLGQQMGKDGILRWNVPAGRWRVTRYVSMPTGEAGLFVRPGAMGRTPNFFSAEATKAHFGWYLERLNKEVGKLSESSLKYFFMESYELKDALWSPGLPEIFRRRNGYDLIPFLPTLDGTVIENAETTERFLFDFRRILSDLAVENHFAKGDAILRRHGLSYTAEAGGPGPPVHEVPFADLAALGQLSVPRGEFWNRDNADHLQIIKGPASAAHLYNKKVVEAESFTSVRLWQHGPRDLKPLADRAFAEGLNRIVYHVSAHTPWESGEPGWVYPFGTLMYPGRAWWPKSKPWHEYLARVGYALQQGNFVADVLYYYGHQAPNFVRPKHIRDGLGVGYDYDITNSDVILDRLRVDGGRLVLPHGQSYRLLVLPDHPEMNPAVLAKLEQLIRDGATVIGPKPTRAHGLAKRDERDTRVRRIADRIWGEVDGETVLERQLGRGRVIWGKAPREVLQSQGIGQDLRCEGLADATLVDFIHRQTPSEDLYFVRNTSDQWLRLNGVFRVRNRTPQLWNPDNGQVQRQLVFRQTSDGVEVPMTLGPKGSSLVVFRKADRSAHFTSVNHEADLPADQAPTCLGESLVFWRNGRYQLQRTSGNARVVRIQELPEQRQLQGPWQLRLPHGWGAPTRLQLPQLISWSQHDDEAVRYLSGTVAYHKTFQLSEVDLTPERRVMLDLGDVREVAEVWLNGRHLGIVWHPPYRVDLTDAVREGENSLVVEVANVLNNRLVGDAQRPEKYRQTHSNITSLPTAWGSTWAKAPLLESGLLGPVTLRFGVTADLDP